MIGFEAKIVFDLLCKSQTSNCDCFRLAIAPGLLQRKLFNARTARKTI